MSKSNLPLVSSPSLEMVNGVPMVSSLKVAEHFGHPHKYVLEAIRKILPEIPDVFREPNFRPTHVETPMPTGGFRKDPAFNLTRDGFTLLAMGFTGKQALAWKLRYIEAFNAMEGQLLARHELALTEARREGVAVGARAVLAVSPERLQAFRRVVRYKRMGLSTSEVAKLMDMGTTTVRVWARKARTLGLEA